ncbi:MAG: hypothetical protein ABSF29_14065, partial [Tepidisphaeraceae bacterium]
MTNSPRSKSPRPHRKRDSLRQLSIAVTEALERRLLLTAVLSDQGIAGDIAKVSQVDDYTIMAAAGGSIEASVGDPGGSAALEMDLYDPTGKLLGSAVPDPGQTGTVASPTMVAGTYTAVVYTTNDETGKYHFSAAAMPGTQTEDMLDQAGGPVSSGKGVAGNLEGQLDAYSFVSTAGATIVASAGDPASTNMILQMDLYDPTGKLLQSVAAPSVGQIVTLNQSATLGGLYTIIVESQNGGSGAYAFSEASLPSAISEDSLDSAGGPVTSGQVVAGNITGQLDAFSLTASVNENITATATDPTAGMLMQLELFDKNGNLLTSGEADSAGGQATLSYDTITSGAYYVALESANGTGGAYSFSETTTSLVSIVATPPPAQTATVGVSKSFSLGSFTETDATEPYSLSVNWGDGSPDTTFMMTAAGTIPSKSHIFAGVNPSDTVSVTITDNDGNVSNVSTFGVAVTPAPTLTVTAPSSQSAYAGLAHAFNLGTITETGATAPYSVNVNWGDGTADSIFSVPASGTIAPQGHAYADVGMDTVDVTITDANGNVSNTAAFSVSVAANPGISFNVTPPASQTATAGTPQLFTLGSFSETGATGPFSVDVNWGDGTPDTVFSLASAGTITAQTHTFATAISKDTVTVVITDADANQSSPMTFSVKVKAATAITNTITLTPPATQTATAGISQSFNLGSFVETNATAPYTAFVNWGEGQAVSYFAVASPGTIPAESYTYGSAGPETVSVTIFDSDDHVSNTATFTVNVSGVSTPAPSIVVTPAAAQTATAGQAQSFNFGSFTETGATGPYSLNIDWNDGTPDTIVSLASPGAIPAQTHTY